MFYAPGEKLMMVTDSLNGPELITLQPPKFIVFNTIRLVSLLQNRTDNTYVTPFKRHQSP